MTLLSEQFNDNKNNDGYELRVSSAEIFEADTRANIDIQVATSKKFPRKTLSFFLDLVPILWARFSKKSNATRCDLRL